MHPSWSVALALVIAAVPPLPAPQQRVTEAEVRDWLRILGDHRPGTADEPVREASQWQWSKLTPVLQELHERAHPAIILRSAALLSDVAFEVPVETRPTAHISGTSVIAQDGQKRRMGLLDAHLAAARRLIDALPRPGSADAAAVRAEVVTWYRTVSAVLASTLNLADLEPHMKRSLARFPDEPGILFDAGCYYEAFASPMTQAPLAREVDEASHQPPGKLLLVYKQSPAALLNEAQKVFRRAIEQDQSFAEARVRLGRVLIARGRAAEAVPELRRAVELSADDTVKYYARMFLAAALAETGNAADAMAAYRSAAKLFPGAQSPQLGISQVALEQGDTTLAREALERMFLAEEKESDRFDPWWVYLRGNGRNGESMRQSFGERIQALPPILPDLWYVR